MIRRIIKIPIHFFESHNFRFLSSVSKQTRILDKSPIIITPCAASRVNDLILSKTPIPLGMRIGIRKRGCNGLSFTMNYVMDKSDTKTNVKDIIVKADNGVLIYIDPTAVFNIVGTVMDWKDDEISAEFTFLNPNSKGSCGCGESFNVNNK
jgi:iron-sulfur cluster assembly accessory protein